MSSSRPSTSHGARFLAAGVMVLLFSFPSALRAEDPSFVALAKSYLDRAWNSISQYIGDDKSPEPKGSNPDEFAIRAELDRLVRNLFLAEKGYHFTQSRWGARPVPYQIDGLETIELPGSPVSNADKAEGIDQRVTFEFQTKGFRVYDEVDGWGKWQKGKPPHLESATLVRKNGIWKVSISPASAYSLK